MIKMIQGDPLLDLQERGKELKIPQIHLRILDRRYQKGPRSALRKKTILGQSY